MKDKRIMSKTVGIYLWTAVLAGMLGLTSSLTPLANGETIKIGGTGGAMGAMRVLADAYIKSRSVGGDIHVVFVPGLGSSGGRKALVGGAIDIALTSKPGDDPENLRGAKALLYGRTPMVFATSIKTNANALTSQDLLDIWNGKTLHWPDGRRLRLIVRPESDSDTEGLLRIPPAMGQAVKRALRREGMKVGVRDGDAADALETTPGALGTSTLALIISEKRSLKALTLDGVAPSAKTIADGTYPHLKSLYALAATKATGAGEGFMSFLRSPTARDTLTRLGFWVEDGTP